VILEDIDRLSEAGGVAAAVVLNCLDGLLELPCPVLWVATSNDPTLLESNLLDRPGRFDRVVVVPLPGPVERGAMLARWSPNPLEDAVLARAIAASDGLTGAHLRQAVASAVLATLEETDVFAVHLQRELDLLRQQHAAARELGRGLRPTSGFREDFNG
jgi:SpoVK/Ycf46/Vps4 family AAA+-type ATPase